MTDSFSSEPRSTVVTPLAVYSMGAVQAFFWPLNHDVAWHLQVGGVLRDGARLYSDVLEFNPPLIYWFSALVDWLSDATGLGEIETLRASVLVLVLASAALGARIVRHQQEGDDGVAGNLLATFLFAGLIVVGDDFGQREHLLFLATWPYLLVALGRATGRGGPRGLLLAAGLLAGLGVALKPHFLLFPLVVEGCLLASRGPRPWRKAETVVMTTIVSIYWLGVLAFLPEYLEILRMALLSYGHFEVEPLKVLLRVAGLPLLGLLAIAVLRPVGPWRPRWRLLSWWLLVCLLLAVAPMKGWRYHFVPAYSMATVLLGLLAVVPSRCILSRPAWPTVQQALRRALPVLLVAASVTTALLALSHRRLVWPTTQIAELAAVLEEEAEDGPVWVVDSKMVPAFPAVTYAGARWGSSFPFPWPLMAAEPELVEPPTPAAREVRRFLIDHVTADLARYRPELVLVKTHRLGGFEEADFRLLEFYARDRRFAELWSDYRLVGSHDFFDLYRRRPDAGRPR